MLQKLHFSIAINAPREKVWDTMLAPDTYNVWTQVFSDGSYYEGGWDTGSKILFVALNKEDKPEGMVSKIAENRLHEYISIEHLGFMKDGVEDTTSEEVKAWAGAHENYTFKDRDGGTELLIDINVEDAYVKDFQEMWPRGLEKLKQLSES